MKIVTLMENTRCREDLCCEHGLSLYMETGDHKILFDAGQSAAFGENAEILGVNLKDVDFAVLSHGHYDHGGGLGKFLQIRFENNIVCTGRMELTSILYSRKWYIFLTQQSWEQFIIKQS